jgi:hypothetical protein
MLVGLPLWHGKIAVRTALLALENTRGGGGWKTLTRRTRPSRANRTLMNLLPSVGEPGIILIGLGLHQVPF